MEAGASSEPATRAWPPEAWLPLPVPWGTVPSTPPGGAPLTPALELPSPLRPFLSCSPVAQQGAQSLPIASQPSTASSLHQAPTQPCPLALPDTTAGRTPSSAPPHSPCTRSPGLRAGMPTHTPAHLTHATHHKCTRMYTHHRYMHHTHHTYTIDTHIHYTHHTYHKCTHTYITRSYKPHR